MAPGRMNEIRGDADVVVDHPLSHLATWMGIPFFLFAVGVFAWLPPGDELRGQYGFLSVVALVLLVGNGWYSVQTSFHEDYLVVERGVAPFKGRTVVPYLNVGRVRAGARSLAVQVWTKDGRAIGIAYLWSRVRGELPEVDFTEGDSSWPMVRARRVAKLVDERVARAKRQAGLA